jgi:membrane-associated protease RseP (regulator of RpoE activity)
MNTHTKTLLLQLFLFIATFITTTLAGAYWTGFHDLSGWDFFWSGLDYSIPFLSILTVHEFGHYFLAKKYKVDVTLPYYIPFWLPFVETIGTFGAFIKMKSKLDSKKAIFDIGIAGPLAGFSLALVIMVYGLLTLPNYDYIYRIHPEYKAYGKGYAQHVYNYAHVRAQDSLLHEAKMLEDSMAAVDKATWKRKAFEPQGAYVEVSLGNNILFWVLSSVLVSDQSLVPNSFELFHYPLLFAAYLALFFTALNLLPVGQLDGGHVIYGLFGSAKHRVISISFYAIFVLLAGVGMFKDNLLGINFFQTDLLNMVLFAGAYLYFLYSLFSRAFEENKTTALFIATAIFATQFLIEYFYPAWNGFNGWMVFAYMVGRHFGLLHPPATNEEPLSWKRKALGWLALVIFVLCFTPELFKMQLLTP